MKTSFDVVSIVDNFDGTVNVVLDMDLETLKVFASIGLMEVFREKAKEIIDGHSNGEGTADPRSGGESNSSVSGDFPGF